MKLRVNVAAAAVLAASLVVSYASAGGQEPKATKHHTTMREKTPPPPSVDDKIEALRTEFQGQIDSLKSELATKDTQLQQAQQAAADAQAAAAKAQAAVDAQQQSFSQNTAAVGTLQSTVKDLQGNQVSLATTLSDETSAIKKSIASPDVLHYKGINITPGGFLAAETVYRTKATGGDIPTAFSSIPYEGADAYTLSEFFGSARQSRITMLAEGKTRWGTLRGYYEADFLGTGITSNNNQSNSYVLRQRILYGQAQTNSGWTFAGGQLWSLATEDRAGITSAPSDVQTPLTIDPNYVTGFVWARQYGFRVVKSFKNGAIGFAAENPQLLYTASLAGNTPYAVLGSAGQNGGNYNAAVSTVAATTYIQNYENQVTTLNTTTTGSIPVAVYNTVTANTNIANLSFNEAPDLIVKAALDPGWGHYEVFGIAGFAHETVFPGVTTNSILYGGKDINKVAITDIETGAAVAPTASTAGSYVNSIILGGVGGSLRVPLIKNKLTFGAKGLYGPGMGRYGDSTLADVTADANGKLAPIHNVSGLFTVEATPTPRLTLYLNYGGDYAGRTDFASSSTTSLGAPTATFCPTPGSPTGCTATPTAAQLITGGAWGPHWSAPSEKPVGYGSRQAVNSGCATPLATPGYNGSSTGYYTANPSSSTCSGQTRDVQEITGGYWYDIYRGDRGRLRQGIQYGYAVREGWSGASGFGAKGIDNMFWTTFRYYLP